MRTFEEVLTDLKNPTTFHQTLTEAATHIGLSHTTDIAIFDFLNTPPIKPATILPLCALLVLAEKKEAVGLIKKTFENCTNVEKQNFIKTIFKSEFYALRIVALKLLCDVDIPDKKGIICSAMEDKVDKVVREAIFTIKSDERFKDKIVNEIDINSTLEVEKVEISNKNSNPVNYNDEDDIKIEEYKDHNISELNLNYALDDEMVLNTMGMEYSETRWNSRMDKDDFNFNDESVEAKNKLKYKGKCVQNEEVDLSVGASRLSIDSSTEKNIKNCKKQSLSANKSLFAPEEILDFAYKMLHSGSDYLEMNCVDLLVLLNEPIDLTEFLKSESWKVRLNFARNCTRMKFGRNEIISTLCTDTADEVRIALSLNLCSLSNEAAVQNAIEKMHDDPNPIVRSHCYELLVAKNNLPESFANENPEVTHALLASNSLSERMTFQISETLRENRNWRIRKTVLNTCFNILKKGWDERFSNFLFEFLSDSVNEIRLRVVECLWSLPLVEVDEELKKIISKLNYKTRLALVKFCIQIDKKTGLNNYFNILIKDNVDMVVLAVLEEIRNGFELSEDETILIKNLGNSSSELVRTKINEFFAKR